MARFDIRETTTLSTGGRSLNPRDPARAGPGAPRASAELRPATGEAHHRRAQECRRRRYQSLPRCRRRRHCAGAFRGQPVYAARKALDQMKAAGWVTERTLEGPEGGKYRVLSPTTAGAREARTQDLSWGMDPQTAGLGWCRIEVARYGTRCGHLPRRSSRTGPH